MDDLELYSTIEYTPGWYYKHFPGFYNIECYKILADYSQNPDKYQIEEGVEEQKGEQEESPTPSRKKIRVSEKSEDGL